MARYFPLLRPVRPTRMVFAVLIVVLSTSPWSAQASTKPNLVPSIHVGEERFPRLQASGDTLCLYGGLGSVDGTFQVPPAGVIPDWQGWISVDRTGVAGDDARLIPRFTDLDPSFEDATPVAGFMADFSWSPNWYYGTPSGLVIDYADTCGVWNEIWSPEIEFDLPGTIDDASKACLLEFLVWRHLPFENGIFYTWAVRSSNNGGATWTDFRDYNEAYFGTGLGDWLRHRVEVGPLLAANATHVQIALGVVDLSTELGLPGIDATPSPVFDNVSLCKYNAGGPVITYREEDLFQDSFAQSGATELSTSQQRDAHDVRIDIARDIDPGPFLQPGDSLVAKVRPLGQSGFSNPSTQILLHWILDVNPVFEPPLRSANPGVVVPGGAPSGWDQYTGTVGATQVTVGGSPVPDLYYFDLPDADFMYPGDELRYYIAATDDGLATTTAPSDVSDFSTGDDWPDEFDMNASPTYAAITGEQPWLFLIKDGLDLGDEYDYALQNLGLVEKVDYDSYTVNSPESCLGNGIGSAGAHGATSDQLIGYSTIIYDCGDLEECLLSDGSGTAGNDDGDDVGLITAWHGHDGDRFIFYFGDNLASASPTSFVQNVMGVTVLGSDVSGDIDGQVTPVVQPENPSWAQQYTVYGGSPSLSTFDEISPGTGAQRVHVFTSWLGTPLPVAASVIWDRTDPLLNRNVDVTFPYTFSSIWEYGIDYVSTSSRAELLRELMIELSIVDVFDAPTAARPVPAAPPDVSIYPNPSNPRTVVHLTLRVASEVSAVIYDVRGRRIRMLVEGLLPAGVHRIPWNGDDDDGGGVASGVYILRVSSQDGDLLRKIALLR